MPRQSNGTYIQPANTAAVSGQSISSIAFNTLETDIGTEITNSLDRGGRSAMTAALPMGNNKITGLATPTVSTDAATKVYVDTAPVQDKAVTLQKLYHPTSQSILLGTDSNPALTITGAANNGSGLIRLLVASTATFATGQVKTVSDVVGTTEANGTWTITVVDATHIDLQGSTFVSAYSSGGTIGGGIEEIALGSGLSMTGNVLSSTLSGAFGYISGLILSTAGASSTFTISAGAASDVAGSGLMTLAASITKTTASWAVGSGNGALDTGSIAISTWYHVWQIKRVDTGVVDILISLSVSAPTMPASYTLKRRIGSMKTNASSQWTSFAQIGNEFVWQVPLQDLNGFVLTATPVAVTLNGVPPGLTVMARFNTAYSSTVINSAFVVYSPLIAAQAVGSPGGNLNGIVAVANIAAVSSAHGVLTNTNQQISAVGNAVGTVSFTVVTLGWRDDRGQ